MALIRLNGGAGSSATTLGVWDAWNHPYATTSGTIAVWADWNNQWSITTSTTTSYQVATWQNWTESWTTTPVRVRSMQELDAMNGGVVPENHEAEWTSIRARNEARRLNREADAVHAVARAEAHKLLAMILTPDQLASYAAHRYFDVVGSAGGVYRIHHGTSGNIRRLLDGAEVNRLCVHPQLWDNRGYLPTEDCLAAQALALMHDEVGAVSKANVHQGQRHLAVAA